MSLSHSPQIVTNGLVLYLDAANTKSYPGSGTVWTDLSTSKTSGTLTNGPTFNSTNGGSIVFDGVNDYVEVSDTPLRLGNTFSINLWFFWNGVNQDTNILGKRLEVSPYSQYTLSITDSPYTGGASNKLNFFSRRDGSATPSVILTYPLPSSGIYHVCVVSDVNKQSLYVNKMEESTSSIDLTGYTYNITDKPFRVGTAFGLNSYFSGNIYQVSVYNRALSAAEVTQNFNALRGRFGR